MLRTSWPEYKSRKLCPGEAQVRHAHPCVYVPDRLRENTLRDVITKLEPDLFLAVTGLTVKDFHLLVRLKVFNTKASDKMGYQKRASAKQNGQHRERLTNNLVYLLAG